MRRFFLGLVAIVVACIGFAPCLSYASETFTGDDEAFVETSTVADLASVDLPVGTLGVASAPLPAPYSWSQTMRFDERTIVLTDVRYVGDTEKTSVWKKYLTDKNLATMQTELDKIAAMPAGEFLMGAESCSVDIKIGDRHYSVMASANDARFDVLKALSAKLVSSRGWYVAR